MNDRKFMLDTDTVSFALRGQGDVGERLTAHAPSEVCLSAISLSELRFGADKRRSKRLHESLSRETVSNFVWSSHDASRSNENNLSHHWRRRASLNSQH